MYNLPRKRVSIFLSMFLLLNVCAITLNVVVNPYDEYHTNIFRPLVRTSRSEKADLLAQHAADKPGILILGSSRSMKINPVFIEAECGVKAFNASVNSARAEDHLSMLRYVLHELNYPIKKIYVGIDVECMNNHEQPDKRLLKSDLLMRHLPEVKSGISFWEVFKSHLAIPYLRSSLKSIKLRVLGYPEPATKFLKNGYLVYTYDERSIKEGRFNLVERLGDYSMFNKDYEKYTSLSADRIHMMEKFAELAGKRGIELHFFITPYHPMVRKELLRNTSYPERLEDVRKMLDRISANALHRWNDYSSIRSFNGNETYFFDGAHMRDSNVMLLTRRIIN